MMSARRTPPFVRLAALALGLLLGALPARGDAANEALLRSYLEVWNGGQLERLDSIVTEDFARHGNYGSAGSRAGLKQRIRQFRSFYRDLRIEVHDSVASEDKGAMRWRFTGGYGETSFEIDSVNFSMYHFVDGRISQEWVVGNTTDFWTSMGYTIRPPGTRMIPPEVDDPAAQASSPPAIDTGELAAHEERSRQSATKKHRQIEITTDVDCQLVLDRKAIGWLGSGQTSTFPLAPGKHFLRAVSRGGSTFFRHSFEVKKGSPVRIDIQAPSRKIVHPQNRTFEDLDSGLMWQMRDNGADISQDAAAAYCSDLAQGGHTNWRLPSLFELEALYAPESSQRFKAIPGISLSGCCPWTSTPHGEFHWTLLFYNGQRYIKYKSIAKASRALCVRETWSARSGA